jgi:hypothetical protein
MTRTASTTSARSTLRENATFFKLDYYTPDLSAGSGDPADPERRRACLPSCAPMNTDPRQKGGRHGGSATQLYRLHRYQARRPGRLLDRDRRCHGCTRMATVATSSSKPCR